MAAPGGVKRKLWSYSRFFAQTTHVVEPQDERALQDVLLAARSAQRPLTFRAGGRAFDRQSLNDRLVVSLRKLDCIAVDPVEPLVRVGPGATWGRIMERALEHGLVPAVTVTTSHATAGGTLSANALSRFSSAYGKEGRHVVEAKIMTMDGMTRVCVPPSTDDPSMWTDDERLFMGAVGGLGYVGAFVEITYRLLEREPPVNVKTTVERFCDLATFAERLTEKADAVEDPDRPDQHAIYGAVYTDGKRRTEAMLFTSSYTTHPLHPMLPHQPRHPLRPFVELGLSTPLNHFVWSQGFSKLPDKGPYVDSAEDYAFMMDGNVRAMGWWRWLKIVQQTYVVPRPELASWLETGAEHFARERLRPTLQDVVALPQDRPFCLTVNPDGPVFAVTYTFITWTRRSIERKIVPAFSALANVALLEYGGRVSLVKNVFAAKQTVQDMFGPQVSEFASLRTQFCADLLVNDFFRDTLG